ncbi:hypothetical protein [Paenibacillus macerans]|uniref:hypothetical protein n=1 Tax=Paenibacillus macerans TaxID=44252 RepID=UPI000FDBEA87|nr:hypothetical protein [Paenibacillus macerans]MCY7557080.1 hypothetical protein [Paenibacillus macerans]MEC0151627.1 hypothetical protein [Paenibacillus macerans]
MSETLFWLFIVAIIVFGARFSSNKPNTRSLIKLKITPEPPYFFLIFFVFFFPLFLNPCSSPHPCSLLLNEGDNRAKAGSRQGHHDTTSLDNSLTWRRFGTRIETATVQKVDTLTPPDRGASTSLTLP